MAMILELPAELEQALKTDADLKGLSPDALAIHILKENIAPPKASDPLVDLLQTWIDQGDGEEDRETGEYLARVLDEDRPGHRKLFPDQLRGSTW